MNIKNEIIDSIETIVNSIIRKRCPVITFGVVKQIEDNKCIVTIHNSDYKLIYYGNIPTINNKYPVFIPYGNMSQAFVVS